MGWNNRKCTFGPLFRWANTCIFSVARQHQTIASFFSPPAVFRHTKSITALKALERYSRETTLWFPVCFIAHLTPYKKGVYSKRKLLASLEAMVILQLLLLRVYQIHLDVQTSCFRFVGLEYYRPSQHC